jgi:superfamily I DNA/RNA helicase
MPNGNDMVLCRNTAPLITLYLKYLRNNKKCFIKGYEGISNNYINYILESGAIYIDKECETTDGLIPKMYEKLIFNVNNLIKNNYIIEEAYHHPTTINMYDDIMGIIALSDNIFKTEDLIEKIKAIFNESSCEGVILTTVHKAKGLEADNVFIYYPSLLPSKFAKKEWEITAEEHLTYVAYTRAKKTLNFIEENTKNYKIGATFNYEQMVKNIEKIKKKMNLFQNENVTVEKTNIGTTSINSITNKKKNNIFL